MRWNLPTAAARVAPYVAWEPTISRRAALTGRIVRSIELNKWPKLGRDNYLAIDRTWVKPIPH
jgi:hypothetical protein